MLVRDLYNELFACEERRWEFHIEYQRLFGVPNESISLDNRKGDLARSFRYHPLMLSTAIDVRPRKKGRKGTYEEQPSSAALSGQMPEADAQVLHSSGRHPDRYPEFQWSRLLRYVESCDLKKELDEDNQQASRCYRHEVCYRDSLG
jgi:hypothetical protein